MTKFRVTWIDYHREPQCPSNPDYPDGIDIVLGGSPRCKTDLPYPAKRCGAFMVECLICGLSMLVTTAGRKDDPRSIEMACRSKLN